MGETNWMIPKKDPLSLRNHHLETHWSTQPVFPEEREVREKTYTVLFFWNVKIRDQRVRGYEVWAKERKLNLTAIAPVNQINNSIIEFSSLHA